MVSLSLILERKTEHPGTDGVGECGSSFYFHLLSEVQSKIVTAGMSYSKVLRVFLSERAIVAIQSDLLFAFVFFISLTSMSKCAFLLNYRQHLQVPSFSAAPRVILTSPVTFQLYVLELVTYISLFLFFFLICKMRMIMTAIQFSGLEGSWLRKIYAKIISKESAQRGYEMFLL
jgi:hypothetical protein